MDGRREWISSMTNDCVHQGRAEHAKRRLWLTNGTGRMNETNSTLLFYPHELRGQDTTYLLLISLRRTLSIFNTLPPDPAGFLIISDELLREDTTGWKRELAEICQIHVHQYLRFGIARLS